MIRLFSFFTIYLITGCDSHIAVDNNSDKNLSPNNSPGLISKNTINVVEFSSSVISKVNLQSSGDFTYEIEDLPAHGDLVLNGTPLIVGSTFTQDDINNNRLSYIHKYDVENDAIEGSDHFVFSYSNGVGGKVSGNTILLSITNFCDDKSSATLFSAYGDGSESSPYLICTLAQLNSIGLDNTSWTSSFKLKSSINMSSLTGTSYNIIGNQSVKFTGNFDGRNNTLSNFNYSDATGNYIGIFGSVDGVGKVIKNIKMTNVNISGQDYISALVAWGYFTQIHNIDVQGNFSCRNFCAGVIATIQNALTSFLSANVDINSTGDVVGGVVGFFRYGTIENAFSKGDVLGANNIAGVIGRADRVNMKNIYNTANITGLAVIGGIVGDFTNSGRLDHAFNAGVISGNSAGNDFVGYIFGQFNGLGANLYYDSNKLCSNPAPGGSCNTNGPLTSIDTTLNPDYFYNKTNPPLSSWDFVSGWQEEPSLYPSFEPTALESNWGDCSQHISDTPFAGGVGTPLNPYIICSAAQLNQIGLDNSYMNKSFAIKDNIDMSEISGSYNIIGSSANPFKGSFSGHGYTINNLTINESSNDVGLVGYASEGLFQGMRLESVNITGLDNTAALIGSSYTPVNIAFSSITGNISGQDYTGGVVGLASIGGVMNSYNQATVSGRDYVGGLVGGTTLGETLIALSYNTGAITGQSGVGGLIGALSGANELSYSFSAGAITGTGANVGQLHGTDFGYTLVGVYIDEDAVCSGCVHTRGTNIDTGSAPTYFFTQTNNPLSIWNFDTIWQENSGDYPTLRN